MIQFLRLSFGLPDPGSSAEIEDEQLAMTDTDLLMIVNVVLTKDFWAFSCIEDAQNITVKINPASGDTKLLPAKRGYKVVLKDITKAESVTVQLNGKTIKPIIKNSPLRIRLENIKPADSVEIFVSNYTPLVNLPFNGEVVRLFSRLRLGNTRKKIIYRRIKNLTDNKPKFKKRMTHLHIPKALKIALKELIEMEN